VNWLLTAGAYAGAISAIGGLFVVLVKYAVVKPIKTYIDKMTYPIQPHANGGKSLPDIVIALEAIKVRLDRLERHADIPK
jgi:hypothetical protein